MARPLRLEFPGAHYHVISRGNARQQVFIERRDYLAFLDLLAETCTRFGWHCHAYCLMGNHYHLVVETAQANLSAGMRCLNGVFTQRYNRRHGRVGHLFQGRFKSPLVQPDSHLLEVVRYVLLNPVRANLVGDPGRWRWSSHAWLLGDRAAPPWADPASIRRCFGRNDRAVRRALRQFLAEGQRERVPGWSRNGVLGDEAFKARLTDLLTLRRGNAEHVTDERFVDRPALSELLTIPRGRLHKANRDPQIVSAAVRWRYSCVEIASYLGMHPATVTRVVAKHRDKC